MEMLRRMSSPRECLLVPFGEFRRFPFVFETTHQCIISHCWVVSFRYDVIEGSSVTFSPTTKPTASPSLAPTTLAPTKQPAGALLCGNGVCDIFEDAETCPSDCEDVIFNANDVGAKGKRGTS